MDLLERRDELHAMRPRPIYDNDFHRLMSNIPRYPGFTSKKGVEAFLTSFHEWLHGSQLNKIGGLDAFPIRHVIAGVTHSLDDMHIRHGSALVVLEDEYPYHSRIRQNIARKRPSELASGDVLALAIPFAKYGDVHPEVHSILDRAASLGIPVHIDAAWYGCLRGFNFNYDHPAIQSISFSLSKGLGLGANRIGVRYARHRLEGPVTTLSEHEMTFDLPMWVGMCFIKEFGADWLQNKYGEAYEHVCQVLNLKKSPAIHLAFDRVNGEWVGVGVRPFLRYIKDGIDEFEYCRR